MTTLNRTLWIVVGLVLVAAGVLGIVAHNGGLHWAPKNKALLPGDTVQRATAAPVWVLLVGVAVGVVLAALGLLLMRGQIRSGPRSWPDLSSAPSTVVPGHTVASANVLARAVRRDI